jgi:hypothetical protein
MTQHLSDTELEPAGHQHRISDVFLGSRGGIASTVYGTVLVMATLTAAYASESDPWKLAGVVVTTAVVLWIAHLYAHGLAESINLDRRLTLREAKTLARRELGILLAAGLPCAALVVGALGILEERTAIWLALGIGLGTLAAEGVRYARIERLGPLGLTVAVVGNVLLGTFVVLLKVIVAH